jgi:hypothetical protein
MTPIKSCAPGVRPLLLLGALMISANCESDHSRVRQPEAYRVIDVGGTRVSVAYKGQRRHSDLFSESAFADALSLGSNEIANKIRADSIVWLEFRYEIGDVSREVLVARRPVSVDISWNAIGKAGAALGNDEILDIDGSQFPQSAVLTGRDGAQYSLRLLTCGNATAAALSEWNLLIGAVHEGDMDLPAISSGGCRIHSTTRTLRSGMPAL